MIKYTNNIYKNHEKEISVIPIKPDFEKAAYQMSDPVKEFVETLKPDKNTKYDFINALGAGETYGANSRGDYFPRQELIDHHKTFETNPGYVYIQHNNKDPQISLGKVLFSHFNTDTDRVELVQSIEKSKVDKHAPAWVRDQINLDQNYQTSMGCFPAGTKIKTIDGLKNIEGITEEDYVLTHTGKFQKVKGLFTKFFDEGIYNIGVQSRGEAFKVTYEHPFLCVPKEQLIYNNTVNFVKNVDKVEPTWIKSQDLKEGDYLAYGFNEDICEDNLPTKEEARLLGYYLSDGYITNCKGIKDGLEFTFNITEQQYIDEVKELFKTVSNNKIIERKDPRSNGIRISLWDRKFVNNFLRFINTNKTLKPEVLLWPSDLQLELLGAFINGDGFIYDRSTYFEISNYELADQLCQIACRNKLIWTIQKIVHKANENSVCKTRSISICYQIRFSKSAGNQLIYVTDKAFKHTFQNADRQFYHKNYLFSKIRSIDFDYKWSGQIYNFEVENDESYIANNLVVHNCKVAHDICSVCNQQNKTVADYCDHLKYNMNGWIDGIHTHAINIDPNFFDNSIVRRGADRIARRISKVATLDIMDNEATIWTDDEFSNRKKTYFFFDSVPTKPEINETNIDKIASRVNLFHKGFLADLCDKYELPDILGTMKNASIDLLPWEYQYLVLTKTGAKDLANKYWDDKIRFIIPNKIGTEKVAISHNENILNDIEDSIPTKSLSQPFVVYNSLTREKCPNLRQNFGRAFTKVSNDLLDTIGESYTNYISLEKTADLFTFLASLFINLPEIKENRKNVNKVVRVRDNELAAIKEKSNKIPSLPIYNPLYRDEFLQKNAGLKWSLTKKLLPLGVAAAGTTYLAGSDVKKEMEGDPSAGAGIGAMARKHPIASTLTGLGVISTGKHLFNKKILNFKKADDFSDSYKAFLSNQSNEFILNALNKISEDLLEKICH